MVGNTALKQKNFEDILYSVSDIMSADIQRSQIFEIMFEGNTIGFTTLDEIKDFKESSDFDFTDYEIKNIDEVDFKSFYEHPLFQRRKPQLVPAPETVLDDDTKYFLLIRGQKNGPFEKQEIKNLIDKKEILVTDLISTNAGHTWNKIYMTEGFDRRTLKENDELPGLPNREYFEAEINNKMEPGEEIEAVTGLAYLGNLKRGKAIEREKEEILEETIKKTNSYYWLYKIILGFSLIGIAYMGYNLKNSLKSPFKEETEDAKLGEQATAIFNDLNSDVNQNVNNDLRTNNKFESRKLEPIRINRNPRNNGRSFTDTQNFRNQDNRAVENSENDAYYYNDTAPIELDPVRTQVSRETSEGPVGEPAGAPSGDPLFNQEIDN